MEPSWKLPSGAQKVAETHAWEPGCCGEQTPRCRRLVATGQNCRKVIPLGVAPGARPCRLPGMSPYPPRLVPSSGERAGNTPKCVTGRCRLRRRMAESVLESRWGVCSSWSVREFTPQLMLKSGRLLTYRLRASSGWEVNLGKARV